MTTTKSVSQTERILNKGSFLSFYPDKSHPAITPGMEGPTKGHGVLKVTRLKEKEARETSTILHAAFPVGLFLKSKATITEK